MQNIAEGEVLKRQQLQADVEVLNTWIIKITMITKQHQEGSHQLTEQEIQVRASLFKFK